MEALRYIKDGNRLRFTGPDLQGVVDHDVQNMTCTIEGVFKSASGKPIEYLAANPISKGYSLTGSGLPYPTSEIAFENTPNRGQITANGSGAFKITIQCPASYYTNQGKTLLHPHIQLSIAGESLVRHIRLTDEAPTRSLSSLDDRPNRSTGR